MMGVMASETDIRTALKHVLDPEIGINIVDLGLVYRIEVAGTRVLVVMTMTSPACPLGDHLKQLVTEAIHAHVSEVADVEIAIEWEPPCSLFVATMTVGTLAWACGNAQWLAGAAIIVPAVLGLPLAYRPSFYLHVGALHLSLILRVVGDLNDELGRCEAGVACSTRSHCCCS